MQTPLSKYPVSSVAPLFRQLLTVLHCSCVPFEVPAWGPLVFCTELASHVSPVLPCCYMSGLLIFAEKPRSYNLMKAILLYQAPQLSSMAPYATAR
eukprot:1158659-Pelagomonas_calceolata.AAC.2